jgi:hypothetical protein
MTGQLHRIGLRKIHGKGDENIIADPLANAIAETRMPED